MEKRAYLLHEFVAHSSHVNCLSIAKKSNRMFITGSHDNHVNLWSIGKTTPLQSLQGHTSAVDSVAFDSNEVLVLGGAANGVIKLWDLEEAKIVRTLTGHRSGCTSVEFHPFGEFFASGSVDTDLKIWDIRKRGCIHTYAGHSRTVRNIKFTPDGRWVVTGGEDNIVKVWDLTAGKLLHEFKYHNGHIRCINFHPHEFLLATGSADRTVKFWDLETFEIIGSAGPEGGGIHAMTFHPDGRTLFCGLDSTLKVYSWEPVRCHDVVDIGWSNLADLSIYEGKLLGFSYQDSRVGVWLADISLIGPYALGVIPKSGDFTEPMASSFSQDKVELVKPPLLNQDPDLGSKSKSSDKTTMEEQFPRQGATSIHVPKLSPMNPDRSKRDSRISRLSTSAQTRARSSLATKSTKLRSSPVPSKSGSSPVVMNTSTSLKRAPSTSESPPIKDIHAISTSLSMPVVVPRRNVDNERKGASIKDVVNESAHHNPVKPQSNPLLDVDRESSPTKPASCLISFSNIGSTDGNITERLEKSLSLDKNDEMPCSTVGMGRVKYVRGVAIQLGKTKSLVERWEKRDDGLADDSPYTDRSSNLETSLSVSEKLIIDEDTLICDALVQSHDIFVNSVKSRLTKLEVVRHFFEKDGIKGAIDTVAKLPDHSVQVDLVGALKEKMEVFNLELFSGLVPVLVGLLSSKTERHVIVSIEMTLELIKIFGTVIKSTLSATSPAKVDLEAERRFKRCKNCFGHLQKIQPLLVPITRRGGELVRLAQELNVALQNLQP